MEIKRETEAQANMKQTLRQIDNGGIYKRFIKRPIDFILALIALVVLSPVLLLVAILVRVKLGSPVIFKQQRPGLNEKIFTLYKFRTMIDKRDENGKLLPDEVRLTNLGKFLRSTSLDELPELWNTARGDMAFVGPRPLLIRYLPYYLEDERLRSTVRPGIIGLAQISGRNTLRWDARFKADVGYVSKLSFMLDIKIIMGTVLVVLKRKDILVGSGHMLKDLDVERKEKFDSVFR